VRGTSHDLIRLLDEPGVTGCTSYKGNIFLRVRPGVPNTGRGDHSSRLFVPAGSPSGSDTGNFAWIIYRNPEFCLTDPVGGLDPDVD
jgi:hypothetical protein